MNRRIYSLLLALAMLWVVRAYADPLTAKDMKQFAPISEGISRASSFTLFEGLPRDANKREKELATKKTIHFHRYPFYERPLKVPADVFESLRRLSAAAESYNSYGGQKMCGGFHPDYCLAWKDGEASYHLLICFGCHEMKLYGPKSEMIVDIREDAYKAFKNTLKSDRVQRPQPE